MKNKKLLIWEIIGIIFTVVIGTLLHFCYEWSGGLKITSIFCAVNESVWEHLKLGFWPYVAFALVEYFFIGKYYKNFWFAKAVGAISIPIGVISLYYIYTSILGTHNLALDIIIFIVTVIFAYYLSYRIITSHKDYSAYNKLGILILIIMGILFSVFTFNPPKIDMFKDSSTGTYGIPKK